MGVTGMNEESYTRVDDILNYLKTKMSIDEVTGSLQITDVVGKLNLPVTRTIKEIKEFFATTDYTPLFNIEKEKHIVKFGIFRKATLKQKYWLNLLLFIATILTTVFAGYLNSGSVTGGILFSLSIMAILTCHELAHYFVSRRAGMVTSLPYFIPIPFHFVGTFGAVIRMKSLVPSRSTLLRVGMAGPLAGFLVALPVTIIGIALSTIQPAPDQGLYLRLGDSLLFSFFINILHTTIPSGSDLFLHPMAFAGWLGFLVTSMNLIPIGQLDGGHVVFSLLLKRRRIFYIPIGVCLVGLGLLWPGWFIWGILAFLLARRDPVIQDAITPLTTREKLYSLLPLTVLILTFIPQPFSIW